jgi:hypothetical protein
MPPRLLHILFILCAIGVTWGCGQSQTEHKKDLAVKQDESLSFIDIAREYEKLSGGSVWFSRDFDIAKASNITFEKTKGLPYSTELLRSCLKCSNGYALYVKGTVDVVMTNGYGLASGSIQKNGKITPMSWALTRVSLPLVRIDEVTALSLEQRRLSVAAEREIDINKEFTPSHLKALLDQ